MSLDERFFPAAVPDTFDERKKAAEARKALAARLRSLVVGRVEWRVQDPATKAYCMAFDRRDCLNPEREARAWLANEKLSRPNGMFAGYEVAEVRWFTELEQVALQAADALDPAT
jgi:hypothetical protein